MLRTSSAGRSHVRKRGRIVSDGQIAAIFLALLLLSLLCVGLAACAVHFASGNRQRKRARKARRFPSAIYPCRRSSRQGEPCRFTCKTMFSGRTSSTQRQHRCRKRVRAYVRRHGARIPHEPEDNAARSARHRRRHMHGSRGERHGLVRRLHGTAYGLSQSEIYYDLNQAVADVADAPLSSLR